MLPNDTSEYCARFALYIHLSEKDREGRRPTSTDHRYTPTLSTCEVARKSFVGENVMLVATLDVRNRSIILPVGMSNVRMIESIEVVTSHLESGENVCTSQARQGGESDNFKKITDQVQYTTTEAAELSNNPSSLDVNDSHDEVVAYDGEQPAIPMQCDRHRGRRQHQCVLQRGSVEVKELAFIHFSSDHKLACEWRPYIDRAVQRARHEHPVQSITREARDATLFLPFPICSWPEATGDI